MSMTLAEIAAVFEQAAMLLELSGANPFKIRAYANAARLLPSIEEAVESFLEKAQAGEIKGVGKGLTQDIVELLETGRLQFVEELRAGFPETIFDLFNVPGLGPKKVKVLYRELGIESLGALEQACREQHLARLPGFGKKSQEKILAGVIRMRDYHGRFHVSTARRVADELSAFLQTTGLADRLEVAGSLRRYKETVKDVDLLAASPEPERLMRAFVEYADVLEVTAHGPTKSSIVLKSAGISIDLRVVTSAQFPVAWVHFTGSKEHNTLLRGLAKKRGWKLSEYGLFDGETPFPIEDEAGVYAKFDLPFVPPELREGFDELDLAAAGQLPELLPFGATRGVVHAHSRYSDGLLTLAALAAAVRERGFAYLGITDHSQTAAYAGGLRPDDIKRQHEEIDRLNAELAPFRIFKGIESDILPDGSLDYDEKTLASFDFVIASVHGSFTMDAETMTRRIISAIENPHTTIVGHLTGRLLLTRDAYAVDVNAVLEAAARHNVAVELNANPHRLDLDWRHHRRARELGVKVPICPDAHRAEGINDVHYGEGIARKGGLSALDVPTCLPVDEFGAWLSRRKT
ncbi:MAG: DNA polymerase/3'-5' exonuclease PolX [Candidatus Lernaella stagnicola]|nr:DNA polymerase/3'-5' exonuclease PolX [Candidatus Lernaella stagnicola]